MIDRVDLLIAVTGILVSVLGSSTALWVALSKKAEKEDLARLESRFGTDLARVQTDLGRVETKLDGLIIRLVPESRP